jgi:hypothetical protein
MREFGLAAAETIDKALFSTTSVSNSPGSIAATSGVLTFTEAASYDADASVVSDFLAAIKKKASSSGVNGRHAFVASPELLADVMRKPTGDECECCRNGGLPQLHNSRIPHLLV